MANEFKIGDVVGFAPSFGVAKWPMKVKAFGMILPLHPNGESFALCEWIDMTRGLEYHSDWFPRSVLAHVIADDVFAQPYSPPLFEPPVVMEGWPEEGAAIDGVTVVDSRKTFPDFRSLDPEKIREALSKFERSGYVVLEKDGIEILPVAVTSVEPGRFGYAGFADRASSPDDAVIAFDGSTPFLSKTAGRKDKTPTPAQESAP